MLRGRTIVEAAGRYLRDHPEEIRHTVRSALGLRATVPIVAFRWLARELLRDGARVRDVVIDPCPPGLHVEASFDKMNTRLRGRADVYVDGVTVAPDTMRLKIRVGRVGLELLENASTPVAALLKAGALDLSRPATLLGHMIESPVIRRAEGDVVELDLMAHPRLANEPYVKRVLSLITTLITVQNVAVDPQRVQVQFRGLPFGVAPAVDAVREQVVAPGFARMRKAWHSVLAANVEPERGRFRRMLDAVSMGSDS